MEKQAAGKGWNSMGKAGGKLNILFTSAGRRSYLIRYFKEALGDRGEVFASNSSEIAPALNAADHFVVTPLIYDEAYIPFLIRYCRENDIRAVIPLFDVDLPVLAKNKGRFNDEGVNVIVSGPEVIDICNDKWKTYQFLRQGGFGTPRTFTHVEEAVCAVRAGEVPYPLIVKPRWGMGSIAVFEAENEEELRIFYEKARRKAKESYLKYEAVEDIHGAVLIQEKIGGQEYGLDVINDLQGNYQATVCKRKCAMRSGETDCAVTVGSAILCEVGERLGNMLRHVGNLDVDVFLMGEKPYILEMNARFGGGYPFSHMAGVDLPRAMVGWLLGETADPATLRGRLNIMSQKDINLVRLRLRPDITIRLEEDTARVFEAISRLEGQLAPSLRSRGVDIRAYAEKISRLGRVWAAADPSQTICGLLAAYSNDMESRTAYLSFLVVDEGYRGLSLAGRLLGAAEAVFMDSGMGRVKLEVRKKNVGAIDFYKKYRYQVTGEASAGSCYMEKILAAEGVIAEERPWQNKS